MTKIIEMTDQELIVYARGLHGAIYDSQCYSAKDPLRLDYALGILEERGYSVYEDTVLSIEREES